jgi:hypothetical protein
MQNIVVPLDDAHMRPREEMPEVPLQFDHPMLARPITFLLRYDPIRKRLPYHESRNWLSVVC